MAHRYLVGENVRLRNVEAADVDFLCEIENDSQNWNVSDTLAPYSRTTMEEYIQSESLGIWANGQQRFIIENQEKSIVGTIDLYDVDIFSHKAAVGIIIKDDCRRNGYGREALSLLCDYCFSHLDFQMLYAYVETGNEPSISVMKSADFEITATLRRWRRIGREYKDVFVVQKLRINN